MTDIEKTLQNYHGSLCNKIDLTSLCARSHIAHKWKLTFRLIVLREGLSYRVVDILEQAYLLGHTNKIVGARILTRSALESVCLLIYMNQSMQLVVENKMSFNDFEDITTRLLFGAQNIKKMPPPINVKTLIEKSDSKYIGIKKIYDALCETAHPNYNGVCGGYIKLNAKEIEADFGIFWEERYGSQHESAIRLCIEIFEEEYNKQWVIWFEALEQWLEKNDRRLERQRNKKMKK